MPSESFPSNERLKSRTSIRKLFLNGHTLKAFPIRLIWLTNQNHSEIKAAFSAPKKQFGKATKRNRIKRLLREAYRKNKYILHQMNRSAGLDLMFIYLGSEEYSFAQVEEAMKRLLPSLIEALRTDSDS